MNNYKHIRSMMRAYINMDAFEITGSSELSGQIDYYISRVSDDTLLSLKKELIEFFVKNKDSGSLTEIFNETFDYGAEIEDAESFFQLVRERISNYQHNKEQEQEISQRREKLEKFKQMLIDDGIDIDELLTIRGVEKGKIKRGSRPIQNETVEIIKEASRKQFGGKSVKYQKVINYLNENENSEEDNENKNDAHKPLLHDT